jgi:hypothetical protein
MGSLEAMKKGSESRYHSDTQALKIAQGVSGTVKDKGSVRRTVPFLVQVRAGGGRDTEGGIVFVSFAVCIGCGGLSWCRWGVMGGHGRGGGWGRDGSGGGHHDVSHYRQHPTQPTSGL